MKSGIRIFLAPILVGTIVSAVDLSSRADFHKFVDGHAAATPDEKSTGMIFHFAPDPENARYLDREDLEHLASKFSSRMTLATVSSTAHGLRAIASAFEVGAGDHALVHFWKHAAGRQVSGEEAETSSWSKLTERDMDEGLEARGDANRGESAKRAVRLAAAEQWLDQELPLPASERCGAAEVVSSGRDSKSKSTNTHAGAGTHSQAGTHDQH